MGYALQIDNNCFLLANCTKAGIGGDKTQPSWGGYDFWITKFCDTTLTTNLAPALSAIEAGIQIYPNPTSGNAQITLSNFSKVSNFGKVYCEIINVMGEKVYAAPLPASPQGGEERVSANLDVSFLAKGIYLIRVGDGKSFVNKKLVIE